MAMPEPRPTLPISRLWGPELLTAEQLLLRLPRRPTAVAAGTGVNLDPRIAGRARPVALSSGLAAAVARLAGRTLAQRGADHLPPPQPSYLRPADARPGTSPLRRGGKP